jgi:hypothetical protein
MIPLLFILPTDEIYTPASGVITNITPAYSHYRHAIQIEFKYNLDEYFYIEVTLSEFDQPDSISLYGYYASEVQKVTDSVDTYYLSGKKVAIEIDKTTILDIVNNVVTYSSFQDGTSIEFRIIQDKQEISDRAQMSEFGITGDKLRFKINEESYTYRPGTKEEGFLPQLVSNGEASAPVSVDGHYNIYSLSSSNSGLSLAIVHPMGFVEHYLFRQAPGLMDAEISDDGRLIAGSIDVGLRNGIVDVYGLSVSMQKYVDGAKGEEYKQYVLNAARDKNLYSEIALLWPSVKHNSMTIYDMKENRLLKGKVDYYTKVDPRFNKVMQCVSMTNTVDFFGQKADVEFDFIYDPREVLSESFAPENNAAYIGTLYRRDVVTGDEDVVPMDTSTIAIQSPGYMTGSNKRYQLSLNKKRLLDESVKMQTSMLSFRKITEGDVLSPQYKVDTIDFDAEQIVVRNGTFKKSLPLSDTKAIVLDIGGSRIDSAEHMSDFAGISFNIPPSVITTTGINITNFSDYVMLCRLDETVSYGVAGVKRGTRMLSYALTILFDDIEIGVVYNLDRDKIYYMNISLKEVSSTPDSLPYPISKYISGVDEGKLKTFFMGGGTASYRVAKTPNPSYITVENGEIYTEDVTTVKTLDESNNLRLKMSMSEGIVELSEVLSSTTENGIYIPRPSDMKSIKANFEKTVNSYMEIFTGLYTGRVASVVAASIQDAELSFTIDTDAGRRFFTITIEGGQTTIEKGRKRNLVTGDTLFDYEIGASITTDIEYDAVFQHGHLLVFESSFDTGIAIDINIVQSMLFSETLSIDGTTVFTIDNNLYIAKCPPYTSFTSTNEDVVIGENTIALASVNNPAYALIMDGDVVDTITYLQYNTGLDTYDKGEVLYNGFIEAEEFSTEEAYIIKVPREATTYIQIKEQ